MDPFALIPRTYGDPLPSSTGLEMIPSKENTSSSKKTHYKCCILGLFLVSTEQAFNRLNDAKNAFKEKKISKGIIHSAFGVFYITTAVSLAVFLQNSPHLENKPTKS